MGPWGWCEMRYVAMHSGCVLWPIALHMEHRVRRSTCCAASSAVSSSSIPTMPSPASATGPTATSPCSAPSSSSACIPSSPGALAVSATSSSPASSTRGPGCPTARALTAESAVSTLRERLGLGDVDQHGLYAAMAWLVEQQAGIEQRLAKRHLREHTLVLYDLTSSYVEGSHSPLAQQGHSRDGKKGTLQIVFGLLCTAEGCPLAVEVFEGLTADPLTLARTTCRSAASARC